MSDKITWDSNLFTFDTFWRKVEGFLLQVNGGFLFDRSFVDKYNIDTNYIATSEFYETYFVEHRQAHYDIRYLYGALKSSLTVNTNANLHKYATTQDGVKVWDEWVKYYSNHILMI